MGAKRLIFFDIDQTLIFTAGSGRRALQKAVEEILHVSNPFQNVTFTGKTDPQILFEALEPLGIVQNLSPKKDLLLWERYIKHLESDLKNNQQARILDGIEELLEKLNQNNNISLALLTGNIQRGAKIKLEHFGLWRYFLTGGFGSDNPSRNIVAKIAFERAREFFGEPFTLDNVFVVGDSLRDIACAEAIGAKPVCVATGSDTYETLQAQKPFALFENFSNVTEVLHVLVGSNGVHPSEAQK